MIPLATLATCLMLVTTAALAPVGPPFSGGTLGRPRYDAEENGLRVPYVGAVPSFTRGTLKHPPRIYLDFRAPSRLTGVISEGVPTHPVWLSWAMAPRDRHHTRLTLVFRRETAVTVTVDRERGILLIIPRLPAVLPLPSSPGIPSRPPAAVSPSPRESAPTMPTPSLAPASPAVPSEPPAPMTPPPAAAVTPAPSATIASATPLVRPTPKPTFRVPTSPEPMASAGPLEWGVGGSLAAGIYEEAPIGSNVTSRADVLRMQGLSLRAQVGGEGNRRAIAYGWLPGWGAGLDLYGVSMTLPDTVVAGSLQARQELRFQGQLTRALRVQPLELEGGLGLLGRYESTQRAGTPGALGQVLSGWRLLVGPELVAGGRVPLGFVPGLDLYGEGAIAPLVLSLQPVEAAPYPMLSASRVEVGLAARVAGLDIGLGYRRWALSGAGYGEVFSGPVLELSGWPTP